MNATTLPLILMIEDNQGDALLFEEAMREKNSALPVRLAWSAPAWLNDALALISLSAAPPLLAIVR